MRRTTACISREIGGNELAISHQLKHVISYGYSNVTARYMAPDPVWADLLRTNQSEENLRQMVAMIQHSAPDSYHLAGAGGQRLTAVLNEAVAHSGDTATGATLLSDSQVAALLKKVAPEIHFGPANACLYDEKNALCRRTATTTVQGPLLGLCHPARCSNSVIGAEHLTIWIRERDMLTTAIADRKVSRPHRQSLENRLSEVDGVLNQAAAPTKGETR